MKIQEKLKSLVGDKKVPKVKVGDRVKVNIKIEEKGKSRIQTFEGIVIAMKGNGITKTITVRKISYGVGVEKIFPIYSPSIDSIEIVKRGDVRRSKLYYMRQRVGKRSMKIKNARAYVDMEENVQPNDEKNNVATSDSEANSKKTTTSQVTTDNESNAKLDNKQEESKRD